MTFVHHERVESNYICRSLCLSLNSNVNVSPLSFSLSLLAFRVRFEEVSIPLPRWTDGRTDSGRTDHSDSANLNNAESICKLSAF